MGRQMFTWCTGVIVSLAGRTYSHTGHCCQKNYRFIFAASALACKELLFPPFQGLGSEAV